MTKIMLVEDDKSLREIYGTRLLAEGYDIVSAGDGEEALAMAIKEKPDLIISDVMMPKISGFEMLDLLKSNDQTKNIKVIMMTALSSDDQRRRGEALGADRYLVKSQVGIEDVVRTVHELLGDKAGAPSTAAPNQSPINPLAATNPAQVVNQVATPASSLTIPSAPAVNPTIAPVAPNPAPAPQIPSVAPPTPPVTPTPPVAVVQPEPTTAQASTPTAPTQPSPTAVAPISTPPPVTPNPAPKSPITPGAPLNLPTPLSQSSTAPGSSAGNDVNSAPNRPPDPNRPDLAQSGNSLKTRIIQPTGDSLSPKVDINDLVAKEEANAILQSTPTGTPTPEPSVAPPPAPAAPVPNDLVEQLAGETPSTSATFPTTPQQ